MVVEQRGKREGACFKQGRVIRGHEVKVGFQKRNFSPLESMENEEQTDYKTHRRSEKHPDAKRPPATDPTDCWRVAD